MTSPKYDAGYPERSHKLCAEQISPGVWCTKEPGHVGGHDGPPARAIDTSNIQGFYAQGTPKK